MFNIRKLTLPNPVKKHRQITEYVSMISDLIPFGQSYNYLKAGSYSGVNKSVHTLATDMQKWLRIENRT